VPSPGVVTIPFVALALSTLVEADRRYPERVRGLLDDRAGRVALAAGAVHFAVGLGLQLAVRRLSWLAGDPLSVALMWLTYVVSGLGLVAGGALPVLLWRRYDLVSPAAVVVGWVAWAVYGLWSIRAVLPLDAFAGVAWTAAQPYPDYLFQWTTLLVVVLAVAGVERALRTSVTEIREA
jgi:hypothetical protein